jgi:hypothetical protein
MESSESKAHHLAARVGLYPVAAFTSPDEV